MTGRHGRAMHPRLLVRPRHLGVLRLRALPAELDRGVEEIPDMRIASGAHTLDDAAQIGERPAQRVVLPIFRCLLRLQLSQHGLKLLIKVGHVGLRHSDH